MMPEAGGSPMNERPQNPCCCLSGAHTLLAPAVRSNGENQRGSKYRGRSGHIRRPPRPQVQNVSGGSQEAAAAPSPGARKAAKPATPPTDNAFTIPDGTTMSEPFSFSPS